MYHVRHCENISARILTVSCDSKALQRKHRGKKCAAMLLAEKKTSLLLDEREIADRSKLRC